MATLKIHQSDDSMTKLGTEGRYHAKVRAKVQKEASNTSREYGKILSAIKNFMFEHDKYAFSHLPEVNHGELLEPIIVHNAGNSSLDYGITNSSNGSFR